MGNHDPTKEERLVELKRRLDDLRDKLPEHCHGTDGYISDHRATPEQWQQIEDLEEEIKALRTEMKAGMKA